MLILSVNILDSLPNNIECLPNITRILTDLSTNILYSSGLEITLIANNTDQPSLQYLVYLLRLIRSKHQPTMTHPTQHFRMQ